MVKVDVFVGSIYDSEKDDVIDNGEGIFFASPSVIRDDSKVSPMFPNEARLRDFTYETEITTNVHIKITGEDEANPEAYRVVRFDESTQRIPIGRLPIMVRSLLCTLNTISNDPKITGECTQD
jgi:DNA-directed RNA polymerase II subunit RPB2